MYAKKTQHWAIFAISLVYLISISHAASISRRSIGINYGRLGNNLPSPYRSIEYLKSMKARMVKLYDADPETLKLLSGTDIHVSIMVKNEQLSTIASSERAAEDWVRDNVLAYYPSTKIRFVLVGNEIFTYNDRKMWHGLVLAMTLIEKSLGARNIRNVKVGTPLAMDVMGSTFPPSTGEFNARIPKEVIVSLLEFLNYTRSFFFIDAYTYYPWSLDPSNINLDYALLRGGNLTYKDQGSGLIYTNLLDQMLDSIYFAMQKLGFSNIKIALAETGWPNQGDIEQPGANIYNAATYNRNLIKKMTADPPKGTPAKPGIIIPTFLFSLYDENQKFGPGTERHWGILNPDGTPIYDLDLTGRALSQRDYSTNLAQPLNNKPYKGKIWCVVANEVNMMDLGLALDMACGVGNGTCDELAPGKGCYQPVSVVSHASYAFNSYWAKYRDNGVSCYFNGLAVQTIVDPSHGSCQYPSVSL